MNGDGSSPSSLDFSILYDLTIVCCAASNKGFLCQKCRHTITKHTDMAGIWKIHEWILRDDCQELWMKSYYYCYYWHYIRTEITKKETRREK